MFFVLDDDECSSNDPCVSFSNNECEDTFGSYVCNCKDGYGRPGATGHCTGNHRRNSYVLPLLLKSCNPS